MPHQIFLGALAQAVFVIAGSVIGGRLSDRTGRRKIFVLIASMVYGLAMFAIAVASSFDGYLVGMAIGDSVSACTWLSTWHSRPTCSRTGTTRPKTSAS